MAFTILIADDSETMRAVIKKTVSMSGIPVTAFFEAENGRKVLEILDEEWVDVILSDINMPVMGGIEMLKEISANEVFKQIPVIFITTESSKARMEEVNRLGAAGYVKKPFLPETIKKILTDVLEKAYEGRMQAEIADPGDDDEDMDF